MERFLETDQNSEISDRVLQTYPVTNFCSQEILNQWQPILLILGYENRHRTICIWACPKWEVISCIYNVYSMQKITLPSNPFLKSCCSCPSTVYLLGKCAIIDNQAQSFKWEIKQADCCRVCRITFQKHFPTLYTKCWRWNVNWMLKSWNWTSRS